MQNLSLNIFLNEYVEKYNSTDFIVNDPISIPHQFSKKQDIEISAFFAAVFAWGQRATIINKGNELMKLMDNAPHDFIVNHCDSDLKKLLLFKHRTFNTTDLLYFIQFLQSHYRLNTSLESAFTIRNDKDDTNSLKIKIANFHDYFFSLPNLLDRTKKHIPTPLKQSACKRICMFLRWMVRSDNKSVDFGIWKEIHPKDLIIPLDLHVIRTANSLKLLDNERSNWNNAELLTVEMSKLDPNDPVKYDFALFGLSLEKEYKNFNQ